MSVKIRWKNLIFARIHANLPVSYSNLTHPLWFYLYACPPPRSTSDSDLISMCQRCSSSLCRFSTAFCFCFFSLLSCSFLARLLGLISTGSSGFTFFYRGTENMWWTCSRLLCLFTDYPTAFFFPFQVSITDLNLRLVLDSWDGTTPLRTRFYTNPFENDPHLISYLSALSLAPPHVHFVNDGPL